MQKLEGYNGDTQTKLALKFLILTFTRTSEVRGAKWAEINFEKKEWRIPAERMKMDETHVVALSTQTIELLKELQSFTGTIRASFSKSQ
jgi:integrase